MLVVLILFYRRQFRELGYSRKESSQVVLFVFVAREGCGFTTA
jgi:hypothetical protein